MATLPSKNALNDIPVGYYGYLTNGTLEGYATVATLLGSTAAQAAAASFSSLALGTDLAVIHGGTGASTAADARTNLGLAIGTDVQAYSATLDALIASPLTASTAASTYLTQASAASTYLTQATAASTYLTIASAASTYQPVDADLTAIAALSSADGNFIVGSATGWVAESGATARTSLGLGNVENTALSTWAGSTSITTLGTIATGVWNGTAIDSAYIDQSLSVTTLTASTSVTVASDLTLASGSITSASGAISFGNENLSTTGTLASGAATVTDLTITRADLTNPVRADIYNSIAGSYGAGIRVRNVGRSWYLGMLNTLGASSFTLYDNTAAAPRLSVSTAGAFDFQSGNITTTGTLASGNATVTGTLATTGNASFGREIFRQAGADFLRVAGGSAASFGANILFYANDHSTFANQLYLNGSGGIFISNTATMTGGKLNTAASTTARASLNIPSGTAPSSPTNGDIWSDGSDIFVRLGGTTYTIQKA